MWWCKWGSETLDHWPLLHISRFKSSVYKCLGQKNHFKWPLDIYYLFVRDNERVFYSSTLNEHIPISEVISTSECPRKWWSVLSPTTLPESRGRGAFIITVLSRSIGPGDVEITSTSISKDGLWTTTVISIISPLQPACGNYAFPYKIFIYFTTSQSQAEL